MIDSHELKRRDNYLNKLIGFQDTEPVKVITGIRRCGKSSLLKLMVQHLKDTGVLPEQIIEMNFESFVFRGMSADDIYRYVKERVVTGKRCSFQSFSTISAMRAAASGPYFSAHLSMYFCAYFARFSFFAFQR